jgi:hypothetical protein
MPYTYVYQLRLTGIESNIGTRFEILNVVKMVGIVSNHY